MKKHDCGKYVASIEGCREAPEAGPMLTHQLKEYLEQYYQFHIWYPEVTFKTCFKMGAFAT